MSVIPEEIQIPPQAGGGGQGPGAPGAMPGGGGESGGDPGPEEYKAAIDILQDLLTRESDNQLSAELSALVNKMYSLVAGQEDVEMKMMGGDPKQMRGMNRATRGAGGGGGGEY